jgi:uncharacterized membrane protein required for colicin V production
MASTVMGIATTVQGQALNTVTAGFAFAAALAWYEVVKKVVERLIKSNGSLQGTVIAALLTTLLAVLVFFFLKTFVTNVEIKEPGQPAFVVTR